MLGLITPNMVNPLDPKSVIISEIHFYIKSKNFLAEMFSVTDLNYWWLLHPRD